MTGVTIHLLAFGFGSPWLLLGTLLAGLPALLHLVFRREYRREPFAANRFLAAAVRQQARNIRFQHVVLLLVRMSLLVLVAVALARPFLEAVPAAIGDTPGSDRTAVHHLFLLDASLSMRYSDRGQRRFDRGREILDQTIRAAKDGDTFRLLVIRGAASPVVIPGPVARRDRVLDELETLEPTYETGDVISSLEAVLALLNTPAPTGRARVSLVTDWQRANWHPANRDAQERLRSLVADIADQSELIAYDVGGHSSPNACVVELVSPDPTAVLDQPTRFRTAILNTGSEETLDRQVEWYVDDQLVTRHPVALAPQTLTPLSWAHRFASDGEHRVEVRISSDSLAEDDRRFCAIRVRDRLHVLLVAGQQSARDEDASTFFLHHALAPGREAGVSGSTETNGMAVTSISHSRLARAELSTSDVVVLCDVPRLDRNEASRLAEFVAGGGGLVIGVGPQVDTGSWNRLLGESGVGLLPGVLGPSVSGPGDSVVFDPGQYAHPLLEIFRGLEGNGLSATVTLKYFRTTPAPGSQVALAYDSGDPAVLTRAFGYGRVLLVTTSLDARWTTWPILSSSYLPMMHELVHHATSGSSGTRSHLVGQPLARSLPVGGGPGSVLDPAGNRIESTVGTLTVSLASTHRTAKQAVYTQTLQPGIYEFSLSTASESTRLHAVNVDSVESNLSILEDGTERELLLGGDTQVYSRWHDPSESIESDRAGRPLGRQCLGIALVLLVIELVMAWRFDVGFAGLVLLLTALLNSWWLALGWSLLLGVVLAIGGWCWVRHNRHGRYRRHQRPLARPHVT